MEKAPEVVEPAPSTQKGNLSYSVGDTVYLDNKPFEITEVGLFDVHLRDPSQAYPIFRVESKERLPALLRRDERNAHLFAAEVSEQEQPAAKPAVFYPADKTLQGFLYQLAGDMFRRIGSIYLLLQVE